MRNPDPAYILGVGMTKFVKPKTGDDYPELGFEAGVKAMFDAHINYDEVDEGIASFVNGQSCSGQRVFYQFGMTQIPIYNINNNCASGGTAIELARSKVSGGQADCILVVGFEKMNPGAIELAAGIQSPFSTSMRTMEKTRGYKDVGFACQIFGNAGMEYAERYGATPEDFAEITRLSRDHSTKNPYAMFQKALTLEQIMSGKHIHGLLTRDQCCPNADGAAAAVVVSQDFLDARPHLKDQAVLIAGQCLATDSPSMFSGSAMDLVSWEVTQFATQKALKQANLTIEDITMCEIHDCFSANAMVILDAMGFVSPGQIHHLIRRGGTTYGGRVVVNPSGGLNSRGHPLGATGIAQTCELVWQLRGWANNRLVEGSKSALQHNLGLGGAAVVTIYKRADGGACKLLSDRFVAERAGLGYNPATELKGFTVAQADSVRSKKKRQDAAIYTPSKAELWRI